ncbi:PREDICTED: zinc transporter 9-like [Acropora digitifera]|uniref:zinc transporter 9-like n=1 Tax=Acropora digitifera TaxID=70779 RepID=UPI00077A3DCD|nr:PREDICTED: zinc transporter 9-like [Acropora digitifera]
MLVWKKLARHVKATCYQRVRGLALWQNGGLRVEFFQGCKNFRSCSSNTDSNGVSKGDSSKVKSSNKKINTKGERKKRLFKLLPEEVNYDRKYYQNTFISTTRAMSDYLLKPSDLEGLKTTAVRSAYSDPNQPPDVCYLKSDVEKKSYEIWEGPEGLAREIWKRKKEYEESERYRKGLGALIGHLKKTIRDHTKIKEENQQFGERTQRNMMLKGSAKVVTYAICRYAVFHASGSNSLYYFKCRSDDGGRDGEYLKFSRLRVLSRRCRCLLPLFQCLLAVGILQSIKKPSPDHPYGWSRARYVYSLISGVGIFFLGAGVTMYHGVTGLISPAPLENLAMAYTILAGSFLVEGATLLLAIAQVRKSARESGMSFKEYVVRGRDPSAVTVLIEDGAAVAGLVLATGCLGLTSYTGSPVFDAIGSVIIGGLLGSFAVFLIGRNADFLMGRSIPINRLHQIIEVLESDIVDLNINVGLYRDDGLAITNATPRETENIKKEICRIFNNNGLRITIEANKQIINFLDVTFNLNRSTYQPFTKPNTSLQYVHCESNHPPITTKNIPAGINKRLSSLSSDKASFDQAAPPYQKALNESGYHYTLAAEVQKLTTVQELELLLLEHGEEVIDMLGQQVDRIEKNIKKRSPEVRHVDLEIL